MTPSNIIVIVSEYFKQPIDMVLSTCQKKEYVKVRQISMYFMRLYIKNIGLKTIGAQFPGKPNYKDHASVLYSVKKVNGYIEIDKYFKRDIDVLDKKIAEQHSINSVFEHAETEEEKFSRLWDERESVLVNENKHLREEVAKLKNEISKLQGTIYAIKLNKRKKIKRDNGIEKSKSIPIYASSYTKYES
jgi:hypothetical protein